MNDNTRQIDVRYYSTKELARLLRVNESTIRRWADSRKLTCFRSPGGHRKYTPRHVSEFISTYHYELLSFDFDFPASVLEEILSSLLLKKDYHTLSDVYSAQALRADKESLKELLRICQLADVPLIHILDDIIGDATRDLLTLRLQGKMTHTKEHLTSKAIAESLEIIPWATQRGLPNGKVAVCGSFSDGLPDVILHSASRLLEATGWTVSDLGSNVTLERFKYSIGQQSPKLVCVSYDHQMIGEERLADVDGLVNIAEKVNASILLSKFENPNGEAKRPFGGKIWTFSSFRELLSLVKQIDS
jgi:excisionase family DNA binding protein